MPEGEIPRWSAAQQAMLREMGLELYSRRAAGGRGAADDSVVSPRPAIPARGESDESAIQSRPATSVRGEPVESAAQSRPAISVRDEPVESAVQTRPATSVRGEHDESAGRIRPAISVQGEPVESPARRPGTQQAAPARPGQGVQLVLLANGESLLRGPHAALVRSLLRALGVPESGIRGEPHADVPAIAFGHDAPGAIRAPALAELRAAAAKRALWPALRALRKRLRT